MKTIPNLYNADECITANHAEELASASANGNEIVCYYTNKNCYCPHCMSFGELDCVIGYETQDGQHFKCENCGKTNN